MADNALHLNDEDKQALAVSIADIVVRRIPRIEPYFVSRADIDVMLGNGYNSSLTDEVIRTLIFQSPTSFLSKGNAVGREQKLSSSSINVSKKPLVNYLSLRRVNEHL